MYLSLSINLSFFYFAKVFYNHPASVNAPPLPLLEEIFTQESRFITSSPLHTTHPYSFPKTGESLEIDFISFRTSAEFDQLTYSFGNSFSDNTYYLEVFAQELCRLFYLYFANYAVFASNQSLQLRIFYLLRHEEL